MCIFILPMKVVKGTRILVCETSDKRQLTVYENIAISAKKGNAMVLPFPLGDKKTKLEFVDLSRAPKVLEKMDRVFPRLKASTPVGMMGGGYGASRSFGFEDYLQVHRVGSYECSVAEGILDLQRINPDVFKIDSHIGWLLGKHYSSGFGFIICQLKVDGAQHPIAYMHALGPKLFVPTRHDHHGTKDEKELPEWDHRIYSLNTTDHKESGQSVDELRSMLALAADTATEAGTLEVCEPTYSPEMMLGSLGVKIPKVACIRRKRMWGNLENKDLEFSYTPAAQGTAALEMPAPPSGYAWTPDYKTTYVGYPNVPPPMLAYSAQDSRTHRQMEPLSRAQRQERPKTAGPAGRYGFHGNDPYQMHAPLDVHPNLVWQRPLDDELVFHKVSDPPRPPVNFGPQEYTANVSSVRRHSPLRRGFTSSDYTALDGPPQNIPALPQITPIHAPPTDEQAAERAIDRLANRQHQDHLQFGLSFTTPQHGFTKGDESEMD